MLDRVFRDCTDSAAVLNVLPIIFRLFSREVERHRSSVLPSTGLKETASPRVRAKRACTAFLGSCMSSIEASGSEDLVAVWIAKGKLLSVLEEENLLVSDDEIAHSMLAIQARRATDALLVLKDPGVIVLLLPFFSNFLD